jgi:hypothetical protein
MARHRNESPECPFIKNQSNNVPMINNMSSSPRNNSDDDVAIAPAPASSPQRQQQSQQSQQQGSSPAPSTSTQAAADESQQPASDVAVAGQGWEINYVDDAAAVRQEDDSHVDTAGGSSGLLDSHASAAALQALAPGLFDSPQAVAALKKETNRLRSFFGWPLDFISPSDLAKSGFIYTGRRDCVRCVFCGYV